jgi:hypothetical protein
MVMALERIKTVYTTGHFNLVCGLNIDECIDKSRSDSPVVAEFSPNQFIQIVSWSITWPIPNKLCSSKQPRTALDVVKQTEGTQDDNASIIVPTGDREKQNERTKILAHMSIVYLVLYMGGSANLIVKAKRINHEMWKGISSACGFSTQQLSRSN